MYKKRRKLHLYKFSPVASFYAGGKINLIYVLTFLIFIIFFYNKIKYIELDMIIKSRGRIYEFNVCFRLILGRLDLNYGESILKIRNIGSIREKNNQEINNELSYILHIFIYHICFRCHLSGKTGKQDSCFRVL